MASAVLALLCTVSAGGRDGDQLAAPSWKCSTEARPWVDRTAELEVSMTPTDVCTPIAGLDCWGNDIKRLTGLTSAADCCKACQATARCAAWTFDTT